VPGVNRGDAEGDQDVGLAGAGPGRPGPGSPGPGSIRPADRPPGPYSAH
jgi:hypothetical protein